MSTDKKVWVRRATSDRIEYALLANVAERDRLAPFGWLEATEEPGPDAWVWMRHEGVAKAQRFPIQSVPHWAAKEWFPAEPDEHVDLTQEPGSAPPMSLAALSATTPVKPAAAGKPPKE